jgi:small conductance mechanosensitive channel
MVSFFQTSYYEFEANMELLNWTAIIFEKLERWSKALINMLPNMAIAAIVMTIAFFISKFVRRISQRIMLRISKSDSVSSLVAVILQTLVLFFAMTLALDVLKLDKAVSSLLAGVGIIGLALGFAFQDLSSNFISGVYMAFKKPIEIGDKVETNGFTGTIEELELRSTTLRTLAGLRVIIPNKDIFQKSLINYSRSSNRRIELDFSIPNTIDLTYAESLLRKAIDGIQASGDVHDIEIFFTSIDDPKIKVHLSFQVEGSEPKRFMSSRHKAIIAINKIFADIGIIKIAVPPPVTPKPN